MKLLARIDIGDHIHYLDTSSGEIIEEEALIVSLDDYYNYQKRLEKQKKSKVGENFFYLYYNPDIKPLYESKLKYPHVLIRFAGKMNDKGIVKVGLDDLEEYDCPTPAVLAAVIDNIRKGGDVVPVGMQPQATRRHLLEAIKNPYVPFRLKFNPMIIRHKNYKDPTGQHEPCDWNYKRIRIYPEAFANLETTHIVSVTQSLLRLIPYTHYRYQVLCRYPYEDNIDKIDPLSESEIKDVFQGIRIGLDTLRETMCTITAKHFPILKQMSDNSIVTYAVDPRLYCTDAYAVDQMIESEENKYE